MGEQNRGSDRRLEIETFSQFIFSEMPIYDRLHVLSLKHAGHEEQIPTYWTRFGVTGGPTGPDC